MSQDADGTVSEHGEAIGFVRYTPAGTALVSLEGRALSVNIDGNTARLVSSDAALTGLTLECAGQAWPPARG